MYFRNIGLHVCILLTTLINNQHILEGDGEGCYMTITFENSYKFGVGSKFPCD